MSKYIVYVKYQEKKAKIKCDNFNSLESGVNKKLGASLSTHDLEYYDSALKEWIVLSADDDLEEITEQTPVRLTSKAIGENN